MTFKSNGFVVLILIFLLNSVAFAETTYGYKAEDVKITGGVSAQQKAVIDRYLIQ